VPVAGGEAQEDVKFDGAEREEAVDREGSVHGEVRYA
jgi:hypothetical protein